MPKAVTKEVLAAVSGIAIGVSLVAIGADLVSAALGFLGGICCAAILAE